MSEQKHSASEKGTVAPQKESTSHHTPGDASSSCASQSGFAEVKCVLSAHAKPLSEAAQKLETSARNAGYGLTATLVGTAAMVDAPAIVGAAGAVVTGAGAVYAIKNQVDLAHAGISAGRAGLESAVAAKEGACNKGSTATHCIAATVDAAATAVEKSVTQHAQDLER